MFQSYCSNYLWYFWIYCAFVFRKTLSLLMSNLANANFIEIIHKQRGLCMPTNIWYTSWIKHHFKQWNNKRHLPYVRIFLSKGWKLLRFIFCSLLGKVMCRPFLCYSPFVQLWVMVKKTKGTSSKRINIKGFMQGIKAWLTFVLKGNGITYYGWKGETFSSQFQLLSTRKQETFSPSHLTFYFLTYIHLSEMEMVSGEDPLFIDIEKWKEEEEDFERAQVLQA